jgi:hypothetical protein
MDLRAAQQSYVAEGQSEQYWIKKAAESMATLEQSLAALREFKLSPNTPATLDRAVQALEEFKRIDRRARDYASSGQKLLASDLIFSDGLEDTQLIVAALDEAAMTEAATESAVLTTAKREQWVAAGAGAGAALFVILLLTPSGARPEEPARIIAAPAPPRATVVPKADVDAVKKRPKPITGLQDIAEVCTQLARVADSASLPTILQRTALALDAAGVVLWITSPDGGELVAVESHGYAPGILARMGPIARDAENVTAAAFRTGLLQTVKGEAGSKGAIAAPLVNASGCVGVLSAEVRNDAEKEPARLALASIVAAQLATLTAPAARTTENRAAL